MGSIDDTGDNKLFTSQGSGDLLIQSEKDYTANTIINYNNTGRVGIGTNKPSAKLDIETTGETEIEVQGAGGGYCNAAIVLKATDNIDYRGSGIFMHDLGGQKEWFIGRPYKSSDCFVIQRNATNTLTNSHKNHNTNTAGLLDGPGNSTGTQRFFTVNKDGRVGIGVDVPSSAFKLDVAGPVRATEYLVGSGSTATPLVSSQWLTTGNNISYSSGKVGIGTGTTIPESGLHISGAGDQWLTINSTSNNNPSKLQLLSLSSHGKTESQLRYNGRFIFQTLDGNFRMILDESGNMGIGTMTPAAKLDVKGTTNLGNATSFGSTMGMITWGAAFGAGSGFGIQAGSGKNLSLGSNGNWDQLFIKTDGNIGVGTTKPFTLLHTSRTDNFTDYVSPGGNTFGVSNLLAEQTITNAASSNQTTLSPSLFFTTVNSVNPNTTTINGVTSTIIIPSTNSSDLSNVQIRGGRFTANYNGTGSVNNVTGAFLNATNRSSGTVINYLMGNNSSVNNTDGGQVMSAAASYNAFSNSGTGTIDNAYGLFVDSPKDNNGTINNT